MYYRDLEGDYDELPMGRCGSLSSMNSMTTTASDSSSSGGKVRLIQHSYLIATVMFVTAPKITIFKL